MNAPRKPSFLQVEDTTLGTSLCTCCVTYSTTSTVTWVGSMTVILAGTLSFSVPDSRLAGIWLLMSVLNVWRSTDTEDARSDGTLTGAGAVATFRPGGAM